MTSWWNEQRIIRLKYIWTEGLSCSHIARDMGAASRNVIVGKANRIGLSQRKLQMSPEQRESRRQELVVKTRNRRNEKTGKRMQEDRSPQPPTPLPVVEPFAGSLNIPFIELRDFSNSEPNQCRFIADEPSGPFHLACGTLTAPGESWCAHCKGIVYRTAPNLSDEDRFRRAVNMRKVARNPQIIVTSPPLASEAA